MTKSQAAKSTQMMRLFFLYVNTVQCVHNDIGTTFHNGLTFEWKSLALNLIKGFQ